MPWSEKLIKPIMPKGEKPIRTLADARRYLLALSKNEQNTEAVQIAAQAVLMAAEERGPLLHANIAIGRLVNGMVVPPTIPANKTRWRNNRPKSPWR